MSMFGIITIWFAYAAGLWGYCLLRGYCVTPKDIVDWNYPGSLSQSGD